MTATPTLVDLFFLPPIAIARVGNSPTPVEAYAWEERGPWVCEACGGWPVSPGAGDLAVGDAALALDPLSSQGVAAALRGAAQAAAVVHTRLRAPEHAALANAFYRDRL